MNQLSWLIYLAEAVPNFAGTLGLVSTLSAVAFALYAAFGSIISNVENNKPWFEEKKYLPPRWFVASILSAWVIVSLVPSKQTIYLIAGSQATEMAITSDVGQQLLNDIQEVIHNQLNELKGPTK